MNSTTSDVDNNIGKKIESVNSREEAYCDGEPMESIRALLLLAKSPCVATGEKVHVSI